MFQTSKKMHIIDNVNFGYVFFKLILLFSLFIDKLLVFKFMHLNIITFLPFRRIKNYYQSFVYISNGYSV